jgi:hypothetical protein
MIIFLNLAKGWLIYDVISIKKISLVKYMGLFFLLNDSGTRMKLISSIKKISFSLLTIHIERHIFDNMIV